MKSLFLPAFIAAIIAFATAKLTAPQTSAGPSNTPQKESAYARVMRTKTLRCGYVLWPDSTDKDPNTGQLTGWVPDITEQLGKKLGLKIEWTAEVQLGQQAEMLRYNKIDALCTSDGPWNYTDAAYMDWTHPMAYFPIFLMVRQNETRFKTLQDFNSPNVTFTAMDGDISAPLHDELTPKAKRLDVPVSGDPSLLALNVDTGKADAVFFDLQTLNRIERSTKLHLKKFDENPLIVVPASFSVKKGEPELLQMLNQGFDMLHNMGISQRIFRQRNLTNALYLPAQSWQPWSN